MQRIERPEEHCVFLFDGVSAAGVYVGTLDSLRNVNDILKWRIDERFHDDFRECVYVLTLKEIADQLPGALLITVIVNGPMSGAIYQKGNYSGSAWWQIGELDGYA